MRSACIAACLLIANVAACTAAKGDAEPLVVSVDSAQGFPIVRSTGDAPEWRVELLATVGSDSGGDDEFGSIRSVLLDLHGNLYVVDPSYVRVSVFDSVGAFVRRVGRRGKGPGEYTSPYSVASLHDSVALLDAQNRRIQIFDSGGRLLRSWPTLNHTGPQIVRFYRTLTTDFWEYAAYVVPAGVRSVFIRYTSAGPADTILYREFQRPVFRGALCNVANGGIAFYGVPFSPEPLSVPLGEGEQAVALGSAYRIVVMGRSGDTVRVLERPALNAPISDTEWQAELKKVKEWIGRLQEPDCLRDTFERPPHKPVLGWLVVDDIGQLWAETVTARGRRYDVFGKDGALRATVTGLPASGGIDPRIVAGRIALVVPDSNGVQSVQVYRIRPD